MKTMPRLKRLVPAFVLASMFALLVNVFASPVLAATVTSVASGAWSSPATWDTGIPVSTDDVVIGAGTTVTLDMTPVTVSSLSVEGTLEYDATVRSLTVATNLSISPAGTLQTNPAGAQTGHNLFVGGNLANDGTLDLSTSANTSGARLTFTGAASNTFSGTGPTTDLRTLTINKGTSNANILEIVTSVLSVQGTVVDGAPMAFLTITNGTLKISGTFPFAGRTSASGLSIPANGGFWLNNPNYTVSGQAGNGSVNGLLRVSQGTLNVGTAANNSIAFGNNAVVTVEGGAINVTGRFGVGAATNNLTYTHTGGVITVCTISNNSATLASFDLGQGLGPDVVMSGGTVIIRNSSIGVPPRDYRNQQGNTPTGISNTVLQFGDAGSGAAKTFNVEGLLPNVVVSNASAGHTVLFRAPTFFANSARDVTIDAGCTFNIGNNSYLQRGSTFTNNGTLTATGPWSRFIWFQSGGNATYQGAGTSAGVLTSWETQMANLTMSQAPQLVARRIIIFGGNILNSNKLTLGDGSSTLNLVQIGNTTTPTSAGAFDVAPTFDLGTGGEHLSYLRTTASRSTGIEVPPGRTLVNLWYDDNDPTHTLTLADGDLAVSGTTALTNGRVLTNANTLAANGVVTRTTGYVDGLLQKPVAVGGPVALTLEVGDALAYSPVDVAFASVTGAGALTGKATGGDHAQIGSSDMDAGKTVNRHWTLTNSGTSFTTADAVFNFASGDIDAGADFDDFVVRKYDAPDWSAPTTGTRTATSTQATGITSFSDFAVGEPVTYEILASAASGGSISPSGTVKVLPGDDQTFTITPDGCHTLADVLVDGVSIGAESTYTFTDVQTDHTITASFSPLGPYTIAASAGTGGSMDPSGSVSVACGTDKTFNITADRCYSIADVLVDGVSIGAQSTYTFTNVTADHTITVSFSLNGPHTITASAGPGGTIDPSGSVSVACGTDKTFSISPDGCHTIADVLVDGVSVGAQTSYTFTDVTADHTISASFTVISYTVAASAGTGGSIDPSGSVSVACGTDKTFNITPDGCHTIADVLVDGVSIGAQTSYTFTNVQADHTIAASFSLISYTIAASANAGGTISPSGSVMVACGTSKTFTITPNACHQIANVLVDGSSVGAVSSYTFPSVSANHTIAAVFEPALAISETHQDATCAAEPNGSVDVSVSGGLPPYTYWWSIGETTQDIDGVPAGQYEVTVTDSRGCSVLKVVTVGFTGNATIVATAIGGGTVSPLGSSVLACGADQSYSITPAPGFAIASVVVDHVNVGPVATYDFLDVTGHHIIEVVFGQTTAVKDVPKEFALSAVYPNPSRGEANIGFALPREARVNLSVVDVAGRLVTTLASGTYPAGRHQLPWKAALSSARAGVYYVRFEAEGHRFVRSIVLQP